MSHESCQHYPVLSVPFISALSVGATSPTETEGAVLFSELLVTPEDYDIDASTVVIPEDGVYLISLTAGASEYSPVDYRLQRRGLSAFQTILPGADPHVPVVLLRSSTDHDDYDTISRSAIVRFSKGTVLYMENRASLYSDPQLQTTWSMFNLATVTSDIFFFVARHSGWDDPMERVLFDQDYIIPDGDVYDDVNDIFTCPETGIYYFSVTTGVEAGQVLTLQLYVGSNVFEIRRTADNHDDLDTLSRSVLVNCQENDEVYVMMESGSLYGDGDTNILSFMGFLYQSVEDNPVAFSAYRTTGLEYFNGESDPLEFTGEDGDTEINVGDAFDGQVFTCPRSGIYYIYFSTGVNALEQVNFNLRLNGDDRVDLYRESTSHNGVDVMGRGIVIHLDEGAELDLVVAYSSVFADPSLQITFFGFLIQSD